MGQKVMVGGVERTIKGTNKAAKGAPRSKRPGANNGAARVRYWAAARLRDRKIRALVRCSGLTVARATALWDGTRGLTRNRMKG